MMIIMMTLMMMMIPTFNDDDVYNFHDFHDDNNDYDAKTYPQRMTDMSLTNIEMTMFDALTLAIGR